MTTKDWDVLPAKNLTVQSSWRKNGNRYSAIRARILIVRHELDEYRDGNVKESHPISVDSISIVTSHQTITVLTDTMTAGLRFAVSQRVLDQLSSKVTLEFGAKAPGYSGKLGSELLSKEEYEFSQTTEENLSGTKSFQISESEEKTHTITLNPGLAREAKLRRRYWPRRWDVYIHSFEAIEFEYKRRWFWRDVRRTMKTAELQIVGWPLFSMTYYEPQTNLVVTYEPIANELTEPDEVLVSALIEPMPRAAVPQLPSLSDLAKLAFPVTPEERVHSQEYAVARRGAGVGGTAAGGGFGFAPKGQVFGFKSAPARKGVKKAAKKATKKATAKRAVKKVAKRAGSKKATAKK